MPIDCSLHIGTLLPTGLHVSVASPIKLDGQNTAVVDLSFPRFLSSSSTRSMSLGVAHSSKNYSRNPLDILGETLLQHVLLQLDAVSLGRCQAVCRAWQVAAKADFLWAKHCEELWEDKIHVHPKALDPSTPRLKAYQISIQEGCRTQITAADLCTCCWNFRFKEGAGDPWLAFDPYWQGKPCMHRFFHKDGFISAEPDDDIWGSHECIWSLDDSSHCVRINNWPPLAVTRNSAWGWRMENRWVVYTSYNPCRS